MKRELLIVLENILNNENVRKAIEDSSINYQDYMSIKDYVSNKTEQFHLIERLNWLKVNNKIYEEDLESQV